MLEVIVGAIIAIFTTILVEYWRKPKLSLKIVDPHDNNYKNHPAKRARFLSVAIVNNPLPLLARWMSRSPALHAHGIITFYHLDGQNIFGRKMTIRWSGTPEPIKQNIIIGNIVVSLIDQNSIESSTNADIYPGEIARIDVAARFDKSSDCFGWSNDNYFSKPIWRDPKWKLKKGIYLVKIEVTSSGEKCIGQFRLINDVPIHDFRIEECLSIDPKI